MGGRLVRRARSTRARARTTRRPARVRATTWETATQPATRATDASRVRIARTPSAPPTEVSFSAAAALQRARASRRRRLHRRRLLRRRLRRRLRRKCQCIKLHRRESSTHRLIYAQAAADVGAELFADVSAEPRANAGPDHILSPEQRADRALQRLPGVWVSRRGFERPLRVRRDDT